MNLQLFEQFLIDNIGLNKETRTKILEYIQKNNQQIEIIPKEESLVESALRHRNEVLQKFEKEDRKVVNESVKDIKDINRLVTSAFEGMKQKRYKQ